MSRQITFREAIKAAHWDALQNDSRVFLMGEDVGAYGGTYAVTSGLLQEFGPERIRDAPLSELAFTGAGIGAALGGMRPIVEIMTVNFSLLALDQIINNAATLRHMSGGQFNVPIVIRLATGAGRQVGAQHSHSFEGWLSHIPGLKILAPATVFDARYMLKSALEDPDPTLIFEHVLLYGVKGEISDEVKEFDITKASKAREGKDVSLVSYGLCLRKALEAAEILAEENISAEVIDLRVLRPLDEESILNSVRKTRKAIVIDEGWKSVGLPAEINARIAEKAFYELDAPLARICAQEVPIPYPKHLEDSCVPQVDDIVAKAREVVNNV